MGFEAEHMTLPVSIPTIDDEDLGVTSVYALYVMLSLHLSYSTSPAKVKFFISRLKVIYLGSFS